MKPSDNSSIRMIYASYQIRNWLGSNTTA